MRALPTMTEKPKSTSTKKAKTSFEAESIARIKSLLEKPDLSPSQRKTLMNLLKRLES